MLKRGLVVLCVVAAAAIAVQIASADPSNAKNSQLVTVVCGGQQIQAVVNGNGVYTPGHVLGSTDMFVPTAFDLTFSFTPTGGTTESDHETSSKTPQKTDAVTCDIPEALNTFTSPEGTFSISGTVTGFFKPGK